MKSYLLPALSALLLIAAPAHAQLGVKGGLNAAVLDGEQITQKTDFTYTYHAGVYYVFNVAGPVSVRPELLYSLQGSSFKSAQEDFETNLSYLNLPLLLDVKVSRLHLLAGPQFGVLLQARQSGTTFTGYNTTTSAEEFVNVSQQVTDQFKREEFSLCAGAELELVAGLRLGGRFTAGLNDIANYQDVRSANDPHLRNRVFQAYAAFQLGGNK
jgi:hypothetical protein